MLKLKGSTKAKLVAGVCLVISASIVFFLMPEDNAAKGKTVKVLVASHTISANAIIQDADVITREVGAYQLPKDVLRSTDRAKVVGKYASNQIKKDRNIFADDIMQNKKPEDDFLYKKSPGFIAFKTDLDRCVGGLPKPGDSVMLKIYAKDPGGSSGSIITLGTPVKVCKILNEAGVSTTDQASSQASLTSNNGNTKPAVVVVEAQGDQQDLIAKYNVEGVIHMVLLTRENKPEASDGTNGAEAKTPAAAPAAVVAPAPQPQVPASPPAPAVTAPNSGGGFIAQ